MNVYVVSDIRKWNPVFPVGKTELLSFTLQNSRELPTASTFGKGVQVVEKETG